MARHRATPLVYHNLRRYGNARVPAAVLASLRSKVEKNARQGLINATELVRLSNCTARLSLLQALLSAEDWQIWRFPDSWYFLHYLFRLPLWLHRRRDCDSQLTPSRQINFIL